MSDEKASPTTNAELRAKVELGVNRALALSMLAQVQGHNGITSFEGQRDYNQIFGYPEAISYENYRAMYRRGGVAKTIVNLPANYTWRGDITVTVPLGEGEQKSGDAEKFESEWLELWNKFNIRNVFLRADRLCGVGNYSVIRIGYTNDADPSQPLSGENHQLLFLSVFSQNNADPLEWDVDNKSENYGCISKYNLQHETAANDYVTTGGTAFPGGEQFSVDASRIVHVAEELEEDKVFGTPRLQACWNALIDRLKLLGGSAEMYFRGAFPGYNFNLDPEADITTEQLERMETQIQSVILGLGRYIQMEGVSVDSIAPQVVDPSPQIEKQDDEVCATTRIPKRMLFGNEAGVLASGQEGANYAGVIEGRRQNDAERWVRDLVNKLMSAGALTKVEKFSVNWPTLEAEKALEESQVSLNYAKAIVEFISGGGEQLLSMELFYELVLGWDKETIERVSAEMEGRDSDEEDEEITEERANEVADIIREAMSRVSAAPSDSNPEAQTANP